MRKWRIEEEGGMRKWEVRNRAIEKEENGGSKKLRNQEIKEAGN